ncbi:ECF-type riboflavin transporter substrate-binding protein, partial [Halomonas sp. MG34]|nr:ECF-type riboflavin transporter substrate-binding protein [Halomonas sp. MG34]
NVIQASVQAVGWILLAPILDILIYAEPANKVFTQGIIAAISNIAMVGILGTLLLVVYAKTRSQSNSLSKE